MLRWQTVLRSGLCLLSAGALMLYTFGCGDGPETPEPQDPVEEEVVEPETEPDPEPEEPEEEQAPLVPEERPGLDGIDPLPLP